MSSWRGRGGGHPRATRNVVLLLFAATVALGGCGGSASPTATTVVTASPQGTAPASTTQPRSAVPKPKARVRPRQHRTPACRAPVDLLAGVYHPYRLRVLAPCRSVVGTVEAVRHEQDGDVHIDLDTGGALTNVVNGSEQGGSLLVEFMPRDGGHLPVPSVGDHISLTGAWVLDTDHGWNELHPVWSETLAGVRFRSGPQYGGSPASVGSSEAAADCTDNGVACQGYGGAAASSSSSSPSPPSAPSAGGSTSSGSVPASHLRSGEFCSTSKEAFYEADGYTCSPGSDGRERLHRQ